MRNVLSLITFLAVSGAPAAALACASAGCGDPTLTVMGNERPHEGRVRVSLEASTENVAEGVPGVSELSAQESRLELGVAWAPLSRLVLAAKLPVVHHELARADLSTVSGTGLGDAELTARYVLWRDREERPDALFSVLGGVKLPTAPQLRDGEEEADEDVQAGTGSADPITGLAFSYFASHLSVHASAIVFLPTEGHHGVREGASLRAGVVGQLEVTEWLAPRVGVNVREDDRSYAHGEAEPDTGGFALFVSPGLVASLGEGWVVESTVHVPVATALVGDQQFGPLLTLGVVRDI